MDETLGMILPGAKFISSCVPVKVESKLGYMLSNYSDEPGVDNSTTFPLQREKTEITE